MAGAGIAIAAIAVVYFSAVGWAVVVQDPLFQYATPPTTFCPYTETTGYGDGSPRTVSVPLGGTFNVSWQIGCEPYGADNSTRWAVQSITSVTDGFQVVSTNLPVVFGVGQWGFLNVTLRAPEIPGYYHPVVTIAGGPT